MLGTLRFSAHSATFAQYIDKTTVTVVSMSVAILCSKFPSKLVVELYPTEDERKIITAPAFKMVTRVVHLHVSCFPARFVDQRSEKHSTTATSCEYPISVFPSQLSTFGRQPRLEPE